jgi:DNA-binding response OmpR family regulator
MATEQPLTSFDDGTLQIDFVQQLVTIHGEPVNLKPPEYRLLTTMVLHQGEAFSPDRLMGSCLVQIPAPKTWRIP